MTTIAELRREALLALKPPGHLPLADWIEAEIRLPSDLSATPGPVRLYPYQRGIAEAIGSPDVERVTLVKAVRVGFTTLLTSAIGSFIHNDPGPILILLPTESDCRDYAVSELEPTFSATPCLRNALEITKDETDRNTLLSRRFAGGSLKIVAARAPRNLRRHTARILICDEADAMEIGAEGNPIKLGERRTLSFSNRKIIIGSTPIFSETSHVLKAYAESDMRVFECPCPSCGAFVEIMWPHIQWQSDRPETAQFCCPQCGVCHDESAKPAMVQAGRWRATKPDVQGHAGFRLNALVSVLPNASWAKLAAEILQAKSDPVQLQVFTNTILAQAWDEAESLDEMDLITKVIPIGLDRMPDVAIVLVAGIDVQDDRLEISLVAFDKHDVAYILAHIVLFGSPDDDTLWQELDELLRTRWRHPYGGSIGVDACAIDSGDGDWTQRCYDFCFPRTSRRVMAIKGMFGSRPVMQRSKGKVGTRKDGRGGGFIWIAGVDVIKTTLFNRLQRGQMIKFSDTLEPVYFEQLASEKVVVRYSRGQPVRRFERVSGRARAESLDCLVYSFAARKAVPVQWTAREAALRGGGTVQRGSMGQKLYDSTQGSKYPIRGL